MFNIFGSNTTQVTPKSPHDTTSSLSISAHVKDTLPISSRDTMSEGDALRRNASLLSLATPSATGELPAVFTVDESGSRHVQLYVSPNIDTMTPVSPSPSSIDAAKSKLDRSHSHSSCPEAPELTSLPFRPSQTSRSLDTVINHNYVSATDTNASELQFLTAKKPNKPPTTHPWDSSRTVACSALPHEHQHSVTDAAAPEAVAPETDPYLHAVCEQGLLEQYARLANTCPSGVYVLPDVADAWVWHGVIFVHSAFYSQGIFRFVIDIPKSYPANLPSLRFTSEIAHPMVSSTGYLDLRLWNPETPYIVLLLSYLKKCMYKPQLWDEVDSLGSVNPEFSKLRSENPEKFLMECRQVAERSVLRVYKKNDHYISGHDNTIPKTQSIPKSLPLSSFLSTSSTTTSLSSSPADSALTLPCLPARPYAPSPIVFRHFNDDANAMLQQLLAMGCERHVLNGTHAAAAQTDRPNSHEHHGRVGDGVAVKASSCGGDDGVARKRAGDANSATDHAECAAECAGARAGVDHEDVGGDGGGDGGDRAVAEAESEDEDGCEETPVGDRVGQYLALFVPQ